MDWVSYHTKTADSQPRPLLVKALSFVENHNKALDLGAGALNETRYLLNEGFQVTAVDQEISVREMARKLGSEKLEIVISKFDEFNFPSKTYDLVCALYALPFNPNATLAHVVDEIIASLKEDGVFCGNFFGTKDSWNVPGSKVTFNSAKEIHDFIKPLEILFFEEREYDGKSASGDSKHWHVFEVITRRKKD